MEQEKIENEIANKLISWLKNNPYKEKELKNKITELLKKEKDFSGDSQIYYAEQRILNIVKNALNRSNRLAIASLVCGIIGGSPILSTASIVAIVLGHIALVKIKKNPNKYSGKGIAITGLILGYIGLLLAITLGVMKGLIASKIN